MPLAGVMSMTRLLSRDPLYAWIPSEGFSHATPSGLTAYPVRVRCWPISAASSPMYQAL